MNRGGYTEYAKCSTDTVIYLRYYNFLYLQYWYVNFRLGLKENYIFPWTLAAVNFLKAYYSNFIFVFCEISFKFCENLAQN